MPFYMLDSSRKEVTKARHFLLRRCTIFICVYKIQTFRLLTVWSVLPANHLLCFYNEVGSDILPHIIGGGHNFFVSSILHNFFLFSHMVIWTEISSILGLYSVSFQIAWNIPSVLSKKLQAVSVGEDLWRVMLMCQLLKVTMCDDTCSTDW